MARYQRDRPVVSEVVLPAAQCAKAIRDHWHIENRSHYVRDGSFAEDASRIRRNPGIFARLRSFAANILRFNGIHNVSDGRHRIAFGGINAILGMRIMLSPGLDFYALSFASGQL